MIDDPAILANILRVLFAGLFLVIVWLGISSFVRHLNSLAYALFLRFRQRRRMAEPEPETYGDDGGRPVPMTHIEAECTPAPEIGSGLLVAGEPEMPPFLKRSRGDQAALHQKHNRKRAG